MIGRDISDYVDATELVTGLCEVDGCVDEVVVVEAGDDSECYCMRHFFYRYDDPIISASATVGGVGE